MAEHEKNSHFLHVLHTFNSDRDVLQAKEFEGIEVRRLRTWVELCLRTEDNDAARELLLILNEIVWCQASKQGRSDALEFGESRAPSRAGVYRDGYEFGFAYGMSERAGEV